MNDEELKKKKKKKARKNTLLPQKMLHAAQMGRHVWERDTHDNTYEMTWRRQAEKRTNRWSKLTRISNWKEMATEESEKSV